MNQESMVESFKRGKKLCIKMLVDIDLYGLKKGDLLKVVSRSTKHGGIYIMENGNPFNRRFAKVMLG